MTYYPSGFTSRYRDVIARIETEISQKNAGAIFPYAKEAADTIVDVSYLMGWERYWTEATIWHFAHVAHYGPGNGPSEPSQYPDDLRVDNFIQLFISEKCLSPIPPPQSDSSPVGSWCGTVPIRSADLDW